MPRQRLRIEGSTLATTVGRILVALFGAAIAWYGLMVFLLAIKISPGFVNGISGYRSIFDHLVGITAAGISSSDRLIVAIVALASALVAAFLLWRGLPRPHLARRAVAIQDTPRGTTEVRPRAIERAVESAALAHPAVVGARARYDDDAVALDITARHAATLAETLREVEERAFDSIEKHELELEHVDVTLAGYDRPNGRELA